MEDTMSISWTLAASWLLHSAAGGGLVLLVVVVLMRLTRQPARQQRLGECGLAAALAVAVLSLGPAWLIVDWPFLSETLELADGLEAEGEAGRNSPPQNPAERQPVAALLKLLPGDVPDEAFPEGAFLQERLAVDAMAAFEPTAATGTGVAAEPAGLRRAARHFLPWLLAAFAVGSAFFIVRRLLGQWALCRLLRQTEPPPPRVRDLFAAMRSPVRLARLLISPQLRVPVSCGLLRPTVVVPAALCDPPALEKLRWVFAHELTHLERRDALSGLLFSLGQALFFYLPWFWWIRRQVRLCQEFVADAAAVEALSGGRPEGREVAADYAEFLLSLTNSPAVPLAATGVSGKTSDLFRRVSMLLQNPMRVEKGCPRRWALLAATVLFSLAVTVSGVGLRADADEPRVIVVSPAAKTDAPARVIRAEPIRVQVIAVPDGDKKDVVVLEKAVPAAKGKVTPLLGLTVRGTVPQGEVIFQLIDPSSKPAQAEKIRVYKLSDPRLEQLRKAIERLEKKEGKLDLDEIRRELLKALEETKGLEGKLFKEKGPVAFQVDFAPTAKQAWTLRFTQTDFADLHKLLDKFKADPKNVDREALRKELAKALEQLGKQQQQRYQRDEGPQNRLDPKQQPSLFIRSQTKPSQRVEYYPPRFVSAPHGRLGVTVDKPNPVLADQLDLPKGQGLVVKEVAKDSPAAKAGIKPNDILLGLGGYTVTNDPAALPKLVEKIEADTSVDWLILRKSKRETLKGTSLPRGTGSWEPRLDTAKSTLNPNTAFTFAGASAQGSIQTTCLRTGDRFNTRYQEGSLIITVTGKVAGDKTEVEEIHVQDGKATNRYESVERVPAQYRDKVNYAVRISGGADIRIETKRP
jgi:beta-lactamase regulating signal transducer with metallopeptidase domain